ncbi:hypothetical protein TorRG33x02_086370 [Trema orientale]|uniref:Uncharacterized protein n=1 Tax=Trema orientale TaxID=63057 RepID=A0A2P5FCH9_TREOI|nr:hypothetical protein TorRG33x02_086370 [Trema orientale]
MALRNELYLAGSCDLVVELVEYDALLAVQDIKSCAFDSCDGVLAEDIVDLLSRVGVRINMVDGTLAHTLTSVGLGSISTVSRDRECLLIVLMIS